MAVSTEISEFSTSGNRLRAHVQYKCEIHSHAKDWLFLLCLTDS